MTCILLACFCFLVFLHFKCFCYFLECFNWEKVPLWVICCTKSRHLFSLLVLFYKWKNSGRDRKNDLSHMVSDSDLPPPCPARHHRTKGKHRERQTEALRLKRKKGKKIHACSSCVFSDYCMRGFQTLVPVRIIMQLFNVQIDPWALLRDSDLETWAGAWDLVF